MRNHALQTLLEFKAEVVSRCLWLASCHACLYVSQASCMCLFWNLCIKKCYFCVITNNFSISCSIRKFHLRASCRSKRRIEQFHKEQEGQSGEDFWVEIGKLMVKFHLRLHENHSCILLGSWATSNLRSGWVDHPSQFVISSWKFVSCCFWTVPIIIWFLQFFS